MRFRHFSSPVRLILEGSLHRDWRAILAVSAFGLLQFVLVLGGSYSDGTWRMPHGGRGFLNHYGVWAILIADPCVLIATAAAWHQFKIAMSELPTVPDPTRDTALRQLVARHTLFIKLNRAGGFVYALFTLVGLLGWLNNIYQTTDPVRFFGHTVFDSTEHVYGFVTNKFVLFVSWVVIYPASGFVTLSMCISTFLILQNLRSQKLIAPSVFHPDGCYGFSQLGRLNIYLMLPFLIAFLVIFSTLITHAHLYASIAVPLLFLTAVFLGVSVMTIYPITSQAKEVEVAVYEKLRVQSKGLSTLDFRNKLSFGIERVCFALSNGSPYSRNSKLALAALRAVPIGVTLVKLVLPLV